MPILKKTTPDADQDEVAALRAEVERLKTLDRIKAKYHVTDPETAEALLERERQEEEEKARRLRDFEEEQRRKAEFAQKAREKALELFETDRLRIWYLESGRPVQKVKTLAGYAVPCKQCGEPLRETIYRVQYVGEAFLRYIDRPMQDGSDLIIYSARNPLSVFVGTLSFWFRERCSSCGKTSSGLAQLTVLE
ncbi:MAG: hypothetical protein QMC82_03415 [Methanolinea sp.]|jgi:hypothetical protein|nr:hypothetical protein [Methanolinea sp.]